VYLNIYKWQTPPLLRLAAETYLLFLLNVIKKDQERDPS
ncbi:uncharacterized protein METZ01_LOCUS88018, partial [marine metagenome]